MFTEHPFCFWFLIVVSVARFGINLFKSHEKSNFIVPALIAGLEILAIVQLFK